MINVFVAFPRWCEDSEKVSTMSVLSQRFNGSAVLFESSDVYHESFESCGSWDSWIENVTTGVHPITRQPKFNVFISSREEVGRATASIFRKALERGKECFVLKERVLLPVTEVKTKNNDDWQSGWILKGE